MSRKRVKLDLNEFQPDKDGGTAVDDIIAGSNKAAEQHGFTSREGTPKPTKDPRGRKKRENIKQITISSTIEDFEWFAAERERMGWTGGRMFATMRDAYEEKATKP